MPHIALNYDAIDTPSVEYARMYDDWEPIHDLLGGTPGMRDAGERWLPREPHEKHANYLIRLRRSTLYNVYKHTVRTITSRPFERPISLDGIPDSRDHVLNRVAGDVDLQGTALNAFAKAVFRAGVTYGLTHLLVDHTRTPEGVSAAEEDALRPRPYVRHATPPQVIGWEVEPDETGRPRLAEIRVRDVTTERVGRWGSRHAHWIRVYRPGSYEVWRGENEDSRKPTSTDYFQSPEILKRRSWEMVEQGPMTYVDAEGRPAIPLVTIYFNSTGFMTGEPPLLDLAWLNIVHWQSSSDQRNILRFSRLAQLFFKGFSDDDMKAVSTASVNSLWSARNKDADVKYVEHTGAAIGAGEEDLRRLEDRMEVLGSQPLLEKSVDSTATGVTLNEARQTSDVLAWVESAEVGLREALAACCRWRGEEPPEKLAVNLFSDFTIMGRTEDFKELREMRASGDLSRRTLLTEARRRGVVAETVDVDEELARIDDDAARDLERQEEMEPDEPGPGAPIVNPDEEDDDDDAE